MYREHEPTIKTKSAALLAAEAAFAPSRHTTEPPSAMDLPSITVLRMKRAAVLAESRDSAPGAASDFGTSCEVLPAAQKVPRVFLLNPAPAGFASASSAGSAPREAQADAARVLPTRNAAASTSARRANRRRHSPPPVTLVFSASADKTHGSESAVAPVSTPAQASAQAPGDRLAPSPASLAAALAAIETTFSDIGSAMRFTVEDPEVAAQWERLSRALDEMALEISASPGKTATR